MPQVEVQGALLPRFDYFIVTAIPGFPDGENAGKQLGEGSPATGHPVALSDDFAAEMWMTLNNLAHTLAVFLTLHPLVIA